MTSPQADLKKAMKEYKASFAQYRSSMQKLEKLFEERSEREKVTTLRKSIKSRK